MQPLESDCIRVLHLEPEITTLPIAIRVHLTQVHLQSPPAYEALSYCWGEKSTGHFIICDDQQLEIQRNLHEALPYLRLPDRERILWIDAICIDQMNKDEKSKQIPLMKWIYESAT
jgi:hypothetical protein